MSTNSPRVCSMGASKTGLVNTIGVTILNSDGTTKTSRATAGIYEIGGGCYGKNLTFDDSWEGSIKWDTGGGSPVYAIEEYIPTDISDLALETTVSGIKEMEYGRWLIDENNNQMIFYGIDNTTEIARFNLKDKDGNATYTNVFERVKV